MERLAAAQPPAFVAVTVTFCVLVVLDDHTKLALSLTPPPVCVTGDCPVACQV